MDEELKNKLRDAITSDEIESKFDSIAGTDEANADDLSWIRAIRDECSAAIRRASNDTPLISRIHEFKLRKGIFNVVFTRDGNRAARSELRGKLLTVLIEMLESCLPDEMKSKVNSELSSLVDITNDDQPAVLTSASTDTKGNLSEEDWDDVILVEGRTVTILGQRKMIIKQDRK